MKSVIFRLGKESRHNKNYWLGGDYIGLGVGRIPTTKEGAGGIFHG